MILFTSDTKKQVWATVYKLIFLALFLVIFNRVYETFSFGESSVHMRYMFVVPVLGACAYLLSGFSRFWLTSSLPKWLFNASMAIAISGCLVKGIIVISGRTTTVDVFYAIAAGLFLLLSLVAGLFSK